MLCILLYKILCNKFNANIYKLQPRRGEPMVEKTSPTPTKVP